MAGQEKLASQTIFIDLDDTLCENNIHFERAIGDFITFLDHRQHTREQVRAVLNQVEREHIVKHGYGLNSFAQSLVETFERLSVEPITPALHQTITGFAHKIADLPLEIIDGVPETLAYLSSRHRLLLMTKGNITEQSSKIERSGLKEYFNATEIVTEKNEAIYRSTVNKYELDPESTWMVGNSPKSDINPALAAGLHAVFVPHDQTWILEHEELSSAPNHGQKLLQLKSFRELVAYF